MEEICFEIISNVGMARSSYIEAIHLAKEGKYDKAQQMIEKGKKYFIEGHKSHAKLITEEAAGERRSEIGLLLIHAEDQLMSAESFSILAEEFISVYKKMEGENK